MTTKQIKDAALYVESREKLLKILEREPEYNLDDDHPYVRRMDWADREKINNYINDTLLGYVRSELAETEAELTKFGVKF